MNLVTPLQSLSVDLSLTNVLQIGLSALLAGLYYLMYRAQKKQTEIQETQSKIMDYQTQLMVIEHQPELIVSEIRAHGDTLSIILSNVGDGRARNLKAICYTYFKNSEDLYEPSSGMKVVSHGIYPKERALERVSNISRVDVVGDSEPVSLDTHSGDSPLSDGLEAKEEEVRFEVDIKQGHKSISTTANMSFTEVVNQMSQKRNAAKIGFDIYLTYTDVVETELSKRILSMKEIEVEENTSLEEALDRGIETDEAIRARASQSSEPELLYVNE